MHAIRYTLVERWYAFEDAVKLSKSDPYIDWGQEDDVSIYMPKEEKLWEDDDETLSLEEGSGVEGEQIRSSNGSGAKPIQVNAA